MPSPPEAFSPTSFNTDALGGGIFGTRVDQFDEYIDVRLEKWRSSPAWGRLFTGASHLGDFSLIWHLVGAARGVTSDKRTQQALVLSALLGAESLFVNQGVKRLFRRDRPTVNGDDRFDVRTPSTSSFPSGHASSAFFAATILSTWGGRRHAPLWFGVAGLVAISRVFVRIHHASDVIGGALLGCGLGLVVRPFIRRLR